MVLRPRTFARIECLDRVMSLTGSSDFTSRRETHFDQPFYRTPDPIADGPSASLLHTMLHLGFADGAFIFEDINTYSVALVNVYHLPPACPFSFWYVVISVSHITGR